MDAGMLYHSTMEAGHSGTLHLSLQALLGPLLFLTGDKSHEERGVP